MSIGSERFSLLICLDATKFVLLSVFTLIETICPKIYSKSRLRGAKKKQLPVDVPHFEKLLLISSLLGTGQREVSRKQSKGWHFTIIRTNFSESRLPGSSLITYIPLTFTESRTVFWWNPGSSEYPFRTGMKITPLSRHSVISKGKSFVMVHIFWELFSALWFTVTEYIAQGLFCFTNVNLDRMIEEITAEFWRSWYGFSA